MPNRLEVKEIEAVGFVDKGANPGSHVAFWKRAKREGSMSEEKKNVEKNDEPTEGAVMSWLKERFGSNESIDVASTEIETTPADEVDGDVEKRMTDLEKRAADAEATVAKLEEKAARAEIAKRVSDELGFIADEETPSLIYKIRRALSDEDFEAFMEDQRAANERVKQSGLYKELGAGGSAEGDTAHDIATKRARERVEKSEGLTFEQAYTKVLEEDRDLAARVNTESYQ